MKLRKQVVALLLALMLAPALAFGDEMNATVVKVDKDAREITVKTKEGEQKFSFRSSTEGLDAAKEGAKVTIDYEKRDGGEMRARKITAR
jgi:hypothetical protein